MFFTHQSSVLCSMWDVANIKQKFVYQALIYNFSKVSRI